MYILVHKFPDLIVIVVILFTIILRKHNDAKHLALKNNMDGIIYENVFFSMLVKRPLEYTSYPLLPNES